MLYTFLVIVYNIVSMLYTFRANCVIHIVPIVYNIVFDVALFVSIVYNIVLDVVHLSLNFSIQITFHLDKCLKASMFVFVVGFVFACCMNYSLAGSALCIR